MPDPTGPTGQPNPFTQQQSVSINTSSAEQALAGFQKMMDGMIKNFGVNWEKASHDGMKAQEKFWGYIGDKASERNIALKRYSKEAIAGIEAETRAKIAGFEEEERVGKRTKESLNRATQSANDEARRSSERVIAESDRKAKQAGGFGGLVRGARDALVNVGGPIGSAVGGIGTLLANPAVAIPAAILGAVMEMLNTRAAFTATGAQLSGAGMRLGAGAGAGLNFATSLFGGPLGGLGQALSADQQRSISGMMTGSRTMIDQARGAGGFGAVRGNLGLFANILPDASKEMEIFTDATKSLGMSQKDITDTFVSSRVNAERLKITQLDAIKVQMDMAKALRNITNDGTVASNLLSNISGYLNAIGASEAEKIRIGGAVGQAGANLSLPQIAGMFAFTHGGKLPGPEAIFGEGGLLKHGGVFNLMGGFLQKVGSQFQDPTQRMFAANQLQQQFLPGLRMQDIPKFFELTNAMMTGKMSGKDFEKEFRSLEGKTPQIAMAEGIQTLIQIVDPIKRIENVFSNFWVMVDDKINKVLEKFNVSPVKWAGNAADWIKMHVGKKVDGSHPNRTGSW